MIHLARGPQPVADTRRPQRPDEAWADLLKQAGLPPSAYPPDLDSAVRQLRQAELADRTGGAFWLTRCPFDPQRQNEVAKALEPLLAQYDSSCRSTAMLALRRWANKDSIPALVRALGEEKIESSFSEPQRALVEALGRLQDERGAEAVGRYLPLAGCREEAGRSLRSMGQAAHKAILKHFNHPETLCREKARELMRASLPLPDDLVSQCCEDLTDEVKERRRLAADWLSTAPRVNPGLISRVSLALDPLLRDPDGTLVETAFRAMRTFATLHNVPALLLCLEENRVSNRAELMQILGKLQDQRAAAPLARRLAVAEDARAASDALQALGPVAKNEIVPYLGHKDRQVREAAMRILTGFGATDGLAYTKSFAELKSPDPAVRAEGARTLAAMRVEDIRRFEVARALELAFDGVSETATLVDLLKALAVWGTRESMPVVVRQLERNEASVRHTALDALGRLKDERAVRVVALRLIDATDRESASKALKAMTPELRIHVEVEVLAGLSHMDKEVRLECCRILGAIGSANSLPGLSRVARGTAKDVAAEAERAMLAIKTRGR